MQGEEIERYAAAVRAALADLPEADRQELLEDLEDHLAEIIAESDVPLTVRLGEPEAYAAELRAAYGAGSGTEGRLGPLRRNLRRLLEEDRAWAFLREFRSTWWLVRGYVAASVIVYFLHGDWSLVPGENSYLLVYIAVIAGSVVLGFRAREWAPDGRRRRLVVWANVAAALGFAGLWMFAGAQVSESSAPAMADSYPDGPPERVYDTLGDVENIHPFSKDGKPLKDILLYDQNGRPILVPYEDYGLMLDQACGSPPPIANSYPLPLRPVPEDPYEEAPSCPGTSATAAPRPGDTATPSPAPSEPTPSPTPSG